MFKEVITNNKIPPNFLNSILTNTSLYEMFKNDFDTNSEYFQHISKDEYLNEMLKFIEDALFSSNIFHIYTEVENINEFTKNKLSFIKTFYDDFLLEEIKQNPENILNTRFFRGLEYSKNNDLYAKKCEEFNNLYDYVFNESIDYFGIVEVLLNEPIKALKEGSSISIKDFDLVLNYVKNNIYGFIDIDLVTALLHNHAYKTNHIFDPIVVEEIIKSLIEDYTKIYKIKLKVTFPIEPLENENKDKNTIYIDYKHIEEFISLNYVELFENIFFEVDKKIAEILLEENRCDYITLKTLMNLLVHKVDLERVFKDKNYEPNSYFADLRASSFVSTLKFFNSFGVNLIDSYIDAKIKDIDIDDREYLYISEKEISLDQRFDKVFKMFPNKKQLLNMHPVLKIIYNESGLRVKLIDLIKKFNKSEHQDFILEYLHSRIITPEEMIDDVNDLASYNTRIEETKNLIETELKYIYVDTFFYSLNSYIKMQNSKFNIEEYLDDLTFKVNCIKDTPLTHKFIDECLFTIADIAQEIV